MKEFTKETESSLIYDTVVLLSTNKGIRVLEVIFTDMMRCTNWWSHWCQFYFKGRQTNCAVKFLSCIMTAFSCSLTLLVCVLSSTKKSLLYDDTIVYILFATTDTVHFLSHRRIFFIYFMCSWKRFWYLP